MKLVLLLLLAVATRAQRFVHNLDAAFLFAADSSGPAPPPCPDPASRFPIDYNNQQCLNLNQVTNAASLDDCINACCASDSCEVYQWCNGGSCSPQQSCWIGEHSSCQAASGWTSRGSNTPPAPPSACTDPRCTPGYNDSAWRQLHLPHDFVVEGTPVRTAVESSGYLPYGKGWYRRHLTIPARYASATMWVDVDGAQSSSQVWLNGALLGSHSSGYTHARYFVNASNVVFGGDNVLALFVDATTPDGWWYDGGGIYRSVWLTAVLTPSAFIAPWGVYAPSNVTGAISWVSNAPFADSALTPSVEVSSNASASAAFSVTLTVRDASGAVVGTSSGAGTVPALGTVTWAPAAPIALRNASLWHLVAPPLKPALYTLETVLAVGGVAVDNTTVTFGVRATRWDAATGFWLNGVNTKIFGNANHQDFAGVGVAVPDHLQWYRVSKLKQFGANGWRTAHNAPTPALLDACDELGFVVWDENHRNGQDDQVPLLIKRDRNHPSVVIWSICNEVLCNTANDVQDARRLNALMHSLDPLGGRPVSANQNGWIGPSTPLDVQGFDYSTQNYDSWHAQAPNIPSISSETSSAVSDRGEYANDPTGGHVSGYDTNEPSWGETAEGAWGGIGISNGQGILTRPFISGGWTWTGWDYRGEPTPYAWPDTNSHFGILDLCGFEKDRFYWYQSWFAQASPPTLWLFPHWQWPAGSRVDVWVYSNADSIELLVNGVSQGSKAMPKYSHVNWNQIPYVAGSIEARAYVGGSTTPVAVAFRNTTGAPAALRVSVRDGVGATLVAGCHDVALVMVEVVDAAGAVVPTSSDVVTWTVTGPATFAGAGNGDPANTVSSVSPTLAAFHGLGLAVVQGGESPGAVRVAASAPGLTGDALTIQQTAQPAGFAARWCRTEPTL